MIMIIKDKAAMKGPVCTVMATVPFKNKQTITRIDQVI